MLFARMIRAALLDPRLYVELRSDRVAGAQALVVVLLVSVANAVGFAIDDAVSGRSIGGAIALAVLIMPGLWLIQATSALMIGRISQNPGTAKPSIRELATALGYSTSPGLLFVLVFIPGLGPVLSSLVVFYMVATMVVAVKATLGVSGFRALLAVAPGFLLRLVIIALIVGSGNAA